MKIVCESCGAKYSIADEKVAGRAFKIRCKKCGAAIVVRGDQAGDASSAAAASEPNAGTHAATADAIWHVVVEGEQQGPLAPAQIGAMIAAGTIGWDAYVWREGFDDWKPAQDVEELVQAIMNPAGGPAAASGADGRHDAGFAQAEAPTSSAAPSSSPPGKGRDAGADLFAQSSASPFGGGDEEDVVASRPSPRVSPSQALTGARNENSVLFSLSNLQALATGGSAAGSSAAGSKSSAPASKPGMAAGEGSGLIDIRALAAAGIGMGSAPSAPAAPARVDDLLSIGTAAPGLGTPLAAPVIIPEKKESGSGRGLIIGGAILGGCVVLAAAAVVVVMMTNQPDPAQIAAQSTGPLAAAAVAAPAATAPAAAGASAVGPGTAAPAVMPAVAPGVGSAAGAVPGAAAGSSSSGPGLQGPPGPAAPSEPAAAERGGSAGRRASRSGGATGGGGGSAAGGGSASASAASSSSAPAAASTAGGAPTGSGSRRSGGGSSDLDALLAGALGGGTGSGGGRGAQSSGGGGGGRSSAGGGGDSSLPPTPSREDVVAAMGRVQGAVAACGEGQHGTAMVAIAVAGATGRVTSATVNGQFAGTPVGSCIARAVRGATFPRFQRETFTINYPFRI